MTSTNAAALNKHFTNGSMKSFSLHTKTAAVASAISFVILTVAFIVISASVANQAQTEQKELAALQAENLAEELSSTENRFDSQDLQNFTDLVSGSRPNLIAVRIWNLENGELVQSVGSDDSSPPEKLTAASLEALKNGTNSKSIEVLASGDDSLYRVFAPIVRERQIVGAVEAIERLDTLPRVAARYLSNLLWIILATIFLMAIAFYLLFEKLVYQPLGSLLAAMDKAKTGNLAAAEVAAKGEDEFGQLASNFNSMMEQIREMTNERTRQNELLQEKVGAATAELVRKNEQLETANLAIFYQTRKMSEMERLAAAGQTAAEFAHEVGTPLNLISGHVQLLQAKATENPKDRERFDIIAAQIKRIERIVREMLDRTRFGKTKHSPLDLNQLLEKTVHAIEPVLEENQVKLKINLTENLPLIAGDGDRLQQVFLNLINNALDAMPSGGQLEILTESKERKIVVEVTDTGSGIPTETKNQIFQPLFTTKERGRGTGLGLFVVKQILHEHEAEIAVESEPKKGAKFTLTFSKI